MKLFNRFSFSSSARRPRTLGRSSQAGFTLIDLAIVFAVVAVVGAPSAAAGLFAAALCGVFMLVALAVLSVVRVVGFLLRRKHREAES
jgi:hypothetical protein